MDTHVPQKSLNRDTHGYFTQVDPIVQRVPGTLLVVGPPGLLKDLVNALALLPFEPVAAGDAWRPRDAVGSGVTVPAGGAPRPLQAAAILEETMSRGRSGERRQGEEKTQHNNRRVYCYRTSLF